MADSTRGVSVRLSLDDAARGIQLAGVTIAARALSGRRGRSIKQGF